MANEQNLKTPTANEARERGSKGGIASGKARREKKALMDTLETLLAMPLKKGKATDIEKIQSIAALNGKNITVQEAIMLAQIRKALKGDTRSATFIRDTAGEMPTVRLDAEVDMDLNIFIDYGKEEGE